MKEEMTVWGGDHINISWDKGESHPSTSFLKGCEDVKVQAGRRALTAPLTLNWLHLINFTGSSGG